MKWIYTAETNKKPEPYAWVILCVQVYDEVIKKTLRHYEIGFWLKGRNVWEGEDCILSDKEVYAWALLPDAEYGHDRK